MIIEEITGLMETFYGESLEKITIERIVIDVYFTGIKLSNGSCCFIHNIKGQGAPEGATVYDILRLPPVSPLICTVKIVVLNALPPFPCLTANTVSFMMPTLSCAGAPMSWAVLLSPTQTVPLACFSNGQAHIGSSMLAFARSTPLGGHVTKHVFGILQRYEAIGKIPAGE